MKRKRRGRKKAKRHVCEFGEKRNRASFTCFDSRFCEIPNVHRRPRTVSISLDYTCALTVGNNCFFQYAITSTTNDSVLFWTEKQIFTQTNPRSHKRRARELEEWKELWGYNSPPLPLSLGTPKRLKTCIRKTPRRARMNGLTPMKIHRNIQSKIGEVLIELGIETRRLKL